MPLLSSARAIRAGTIPVLRVYYNKGIVWPPTKLTGGPWVITDQWVLGMSWLALPAPKPPPTGATRLYYVLLEGPPPPPPAPLPRVRISWIRLTQT